MAYNLQYIMLPYIVNILLSHAFRQIEFDWMTRKIQACALVSVTWYLDIRSVKAFT